MALDFDLEINSRLTPEQATQIICRLEGFAKTVDENGFYAKGVGGGVDSLEQRDGYYAQVHREMMQESFGFEPTLKIWFRPDGYDDYEIGMRNGLKAFMEILKHDDGDAVCIMNGEHIKFTRINGRLTLNFNSFREDENSIWSYKEVPFSFETKEFPIFG